MENGATSTDGRDPSGFLSEIIGAAVTVKLNSGVIYKGNTLQYSRKSIYLDDLYRGASIGGRLHEHRIGEDGGIREWQAEEQLWGCICQGQQR